MKQLGINMTCLFLAGLKVPRLHKLDAACERAMPRPVRAQHYGEGVERCRLLCNAICHRKPPHGKVYLRCSVVLLEGVAIAVIPCVQHTKLELVKDLPQLTCISLPVRLGRCCAHQLALPDQVRVEVTRQQQPISHWERCQLGIKLSEQLSSLVEAILVVWLVDMLVDMDYIDWCAV